MSLNPAAFLTSALTSGLVCVGLLTSSLSAEAGNMSQMGSWSGNVPRGPLIANDPNCKQGNGGHNGGDYGGGHSVSTNISNINVYKPVTVNNNVNVNNNIDIYKPVTINKIIDNSKNINIVNNIDASKNININKNIDNSKNININKIININKGGGDSSAEAEALALAAALANSSSSSSAVVNFNGGNSTGSTVTNSSSSNAYNNAGGSESFASAFGYSGSGTVTGGSSYIEAPASFSSGDIGTLNVEAAAAPAPAQAQAQCTFQDATVIKAIHAVCVSADNHEFPASHMTGDTWIDASYEGEIARCIPGSHLKVTVGAVYQSNEGLASSWSHGQVLECGAHEAVRSFKDGILKCAPAVAVPDCTERTNLRKWGTGDMFFTYRTKVCLETHQEYSEIIARDEDLQSRGYNSAPR